MRKLLLFACAVLFAMELFAQTYQPSWESLDKRPVPEWYREAKFGIFIHWGVYSVPGFTRKGQYAEWYQHQLNSKDTAVLRYHAAKFGDRTYYQLADDFKAELYDPAEWAKVIEGSGAKYVVLTSKHHDGFANWPSAATATAWPMPWNSGVTGPRRDLLGDLFAAIRKTSVHPGMYYSLYEWYNPMWLKDRRKYVAEYMLPQMNDLVNRYQPDVFWTDGDWEDSDTLFQSREWLAWLYNSSPVKDRVVTFDRWGRGVRFHHGQVYTPEYQPDMDFKDHYFEENRGMGFSYGYNRAEDVWDYNSAQTLVLSLIDKVSRGGNFLLDIGPDEHGKIPPVMEERLGQIGHWMTINGEAIYGSVRWKETSQGGVGGFAVKGCFFTYHPGRKDLYVLLPKWPATGKFTVRGLSLPAGTSVQLLETKQALSWKAVGKDLEITMPAFDPNKIFSEYVYVIKIHSINEK